MKKYILYLLLVLTLITTITGCGKNDKTGPKGDKGEDGVTPTVSISDDGYWVINGEKTNVKAEADSATVDENPLGLDFYLKPDGTYAVAAGNAKYLDKIVIPKTYKGKAVTEIAQEAFRESPKYLHH